MHYLKQGLPQYAWGRNDMITIPKLICLYVYFFLVISPWVCFFLQNRKQNDIIKRSARFFSESEYKNAWNETYNNFIFGRIMRMYLILKNQNILDIDIRAECVKYKILTYSIFVSVSLLVIFAFIANKICI